MKIIKVILKDCLLLAGWIVGVAVLAAIVCLCLIVICILVIVNIRLRRQMTYIAAGDTTDNSYIELKVSIKLPGTVVLEKCNLAHNVVFPLL